MQADPYSDDRLLVERCLAGETGAWEAFVQRHAPELSRAVRSVLARRGKGGDSALAEDLVQETFALLVAGDRAKLREFRWECPLPLYLRVFAVRLAQDALRKGGAARRVDNGALLEALAADVPPVGRGLEQGETEDRVREALERLPAREQLALKLVYWERSSPKAVSKLLGLDPNALHVLLHRARARLAGTLRSIFCL